MFDIGAQRRGTGATQLIVIQNLTTELQAQVLR